METRVKWMPSSTKERIHVRALSRNQVFENINNHRGNQRNQRGQGDIYQNTSRKPTTTENHNFQTHVGQRGHGSERLLFVVLVVSIVVDSVCLDLFGCFGFFGFPGGC